MGSGASFDSSTISLAQSRRSSYFCHSCSCLFQNPSASTGITCPSCDSTFVEEMNDFRDHFIIGRRNELNDEQARRLANAAIMLRILEAQLREELESLQLAFSNGRSDRGGDSSRSNVLSQTMIDKMRVIKPSVDMICSLPACPICSEDFDENVEVTQLPCSHFFHKSCLFQWFEMKHTCPICRNEQNDNIPTIEELLRFTELELISRLDSNKDSIKDSYETLEKRALAQLVFDHMTKEKLEASSKPNHENISDI